MAPRIKQLTPQESCIVDCLLDTYQALQIPQTDPDSALTFSTDHAIYRCIKIATWKLGFTNHDAECIALAWQRQCPTIHDFDVKQWPTERALFTQHIPLSTHIAEPFPSCPKKLGLYVIAPTAHWLGLLANEGVQTLQLRFKSEDPQEIDEEVHRAIEAVQGHSVRLFINDHWQAAIRYQAYGVHLGQEDLEQANLKAIHTSGLRLGVSSHGYREMIRAANIKPSYIALGAVFPTTLKKMVTAPQGLGRLQKYAQFLHDFPLVGIGGIDASSIQSVLDCGVGSVAMVRAVTQADDYKVVIAQLKKYF